jgi:phenylacetate-coenzyme A ligase PaaK-like adenylate-forming protein
VETSEKYRIVFSERVNDGSGFLTVEVECTSFETYTENNQVFIQLLVKDAEGDDTVVFLASSSSILYFQKV